jgi:hypothetical protein
MTGGYGHAALRTFYQQDFITPMPADVAIQLVSRTLGQDQLVDGKLSFPSRTPKRCRGCFRAWPRRIGA